MKHASRFDKEQAKKEIKFNIDICITNMIRALHVHAYTSIGQRGHREGPQASQEGAWRALGWGRARDPSGVPVVALPSFLGDSGGFRDADFLYNFSGIFGALLMAGKPEIQKQQKTGTGNWVH